ncbi:uncharacterized protein LOC132563813 isoform X2 [Ylistrum balloti]|uniref:uncharacterized protein LOC132563813 isoform X2 n=1 Tax=Ylistrum balloti TaxID=509963 RepID=UPI002905A8B0|nr:uncharacterized protein LOC132563813 isoform X2 [Ylistrum balloti]
MDRQGALPPPPSYEEAQGLQISGPTSATDDSGDTPASTPLLGEIGGSTPTPDPQNRNFGQFGAFPASTVAASSNMGGTSFTNVTSGTAGSVPSTTDTDGPTSIPIPPGHVPVITCHSCGARQQIGQYSFLPKTQVISMQARDSGINFYSPQPRGPEVTAPTYMITAGQQPGYPPSLPASGIVPSQQQCNVAVHYNSNQGTVQSQPATSQNDSETPPNATHDDSNIGCCRICCGTFICIIILTIIIVVSTNS